MKKIQPLVIIILLIAVVCLLITNRGEKEKVIEKHSSIMQEIEKLGNLEVLKYNIQDLMEYKKMRKWLPNSKTILKVSGEVVVCIDLSQIKQTDVYTLKDSVSITLPKPKICYTKINHNNSQVYDVQYGLWESAQLVDEAYVLAEKHIAEKAYSYGVEEMGKENATKMLSLFLNSLGFTKVNIEFKLLDDRDFN